MRGFENHTSPRLVGPSIVLVPLTIPALSVRTDISWPGLVLDRCRLVLDRQTLTHA